MEDTISAVLQNGVDVRHDIGEFVLFGVLGDTLNTFISDAQTDLIELVVHNVLESLDVPSECLDVVLEIGVDRFEFVLDGFCDVKHPLKRGGFEGRLFFLFFEFVVECFDPSGALKQEAEVTREELQCVDIPFVECLLVRTLYGNDREQLGGVRDWYDASRDKWGFWGGE